MLLLRLLVVVLYFFAPVAAFAQQEAAQQSPEKPGSPMLMLKKNEPTHPEKILMMFDKLSGQQPDFVAWAKASPFLKDAKEGDAPVIMNRETNRLTQDYANLDMNAPLVVEATIHLDDYSTIREVLTLSEFTPQTFFSYGIYGQNVAIVPKGIARFATIPLAKDKMDEMLARARGGDVTAELLLKPVLADGKTPFVQGGTSYWLMLAEIGEIRFWSGSPTPQLLWTYRADWYKPQENRELLDLKPGSTLM